MKHWTTRLGLLALALIGTISSVPAQSGSNVSDEIEQSEKAAKVFNEVMAVPDKSIPLSVLDDAECVAVFPNVIQAAFGIGGRGGRGVASCRAASGWTPPAYFNLGGGSFGFQLGVESTDLVMLFMTPDSMNSLLGNKFELGAGASVAAGPVGRQAGASTDLKLNAQILSYSRNKGLFAGVALKGAVIEPADDDMRDVYGAGVKSKDVLKGGKVEPSAGVMAFPNALKAARGSKPS